MNKASAYHVDCIRVTNGLPDRAPRAHTTPDFGARMRVGLGAKNLALLGSRSSSILPQITDVPHRYMEMRRLTRRSIEFNQPESYRNWRVKKKKNHRDPDGASCRVVEF